jgi:hypothetical protein
MTTQPETIWPTNDREWARAHHDIAERHLESPPLVPVGSCCGYPEKPYCDCLATAPAPARLLIAFTGLAGAGKSTAAAHLTQHRGFTRVRFAGPLKAMMAALGLSEREVDGDLKETPCELLCGRTPRQAMQWLGTEFGRNLIGPDIWIRAWQAALPATGNVVVDDCRFPNERDAVRAAGGILVRIERPGAGAGAAGHSSEAHALPATCTLHNTLSQRNLREQVDVLLRYLSWAESSAVAG